MITQPRPHVLFIAYPFPPMPKVACIRTASIAKYLAVRSGWRVTVVTAGSSDPTFLDRAKLVDEEFAGLGVTVVRFGTVLEGELGRGGASGGAGRLRGFFRRGLCRKLYAVGIDGRLFWLLAAERGCRVVLRAEDVDVIMATGDPFGSFPMAQRLARKLRCPYVLDYRDLWGGNPSSSHGATLKWVERRALEHCTGVSVVSPSMGAWLADRAPIAAKLHVIHNGYDPDEFAGVVPTGYGHPAIIYAGGLKPPIRSVEPLIKALVRLQSKVDDDSWRFHYYGPHGEYVQRVAREAGIAHRVIDHRRVERGAVLSALRGAVCAVVISTVADSVTLPEAGIVTGKVFETMGLNVPTLVIAAPGSDIRTVMDEAGHGAVFAGSDIDGMTGFLSNLIVKGLSTLPPRDGGDQYGWPRAIERVDAMLRVAISGGGS